MLDAASLIAPAGMPTGEVEVPGKGTVTVRGLTRAECMRVQEANGTAATERLILHLGLVEPKLTESQVTAWMGNAASAEIDPVSRRIAQLSGMLEDAGKSGLPADGDRPVD